jgi:hypothetical protein
MSTAPARVTAEFEGYEFVPGEVFGTRSFRVDKMGRLTGVSFRVVWRPGVNEATCQNDDTLFAHRRWAPELYELLTGVPASQSLMEEEERRRMHSHPGAKFWPFGAETYTIPTYATYVGSNAAVNYPVPSGPPPFDEAVSELDRKRVMDVPHRIDQCKHGFYAYYEGSNDYHDQSSGVNAVIKGFGDATIGTRGFRCMKAEIVALHFDTDRVSLPTQSLIRRNYPGVPIFKTFEVMVGEFPPSVGESKVGPDADPDFWTRSV